VRLAAPIAVLLCAALVAAGCGGGASGGSNSTAPPGGTNGGGTPKKATAPNAPAGSKVVACKMGGITAMGGLRATAVDCGTAREAMMRWQGTRACGLAEDAARGSCSVDGFRCQAVKADRGVAVSCARPGGDVAFVARRSGAG
jgi:hypothetical protein